MSQLPTATVAAKDLSGVAWMGSSSLVGSLNPHNHGFRTSDGSGGYIITNTHTKYKRIKRDGEGRVVTEEEELEETVSNLLVQFCNRDGENVGEAMDVPTSAGSEELASLLTTLLHPDDDEDDGTKKGRIPYAFFARVTRTIETRHPSTLESIAEKVSENIDITDYPSLSHFLRRYRDDVSTEHTLRLTYQPLALFRVRPVTRCTDTLPGHTDAILHVTYSPDGTHLASGGGDYSVRFWDTNTCTPRKTCRAHSDHVLCASWSRDGMRLASGDRRGNLILWDPTAGKERGVIKAHSKWITGIDWEPMHRNKSCERLVSCSNDGLAKIWNRRTRACEATLAGHSNSVECVKWGGEGLIYTASRDRTIKVWNGQDGGGTDGKSRAGILVRTLLGHGHRVNTLAVSCDYVCRTGPFDHYGKVAGVETKDRESKEWRDAAFRAAAEKYGAFKRADEPERLVSGSDDNTLMIWHPTLDKRPIKRLVGHQQAVNHILFSPDARFFASASFDKKVKVWNGRTGDFLNTLTGHVGAVYQVAWSSDGRYLVSASKDSTAKLWEMPSGKRARETLPGHEDEVYALDWSPCGGSVATGSKDRKIKIWKH